jgi:hypothetical protein
MPNNYNPEYDQNLPPPAGNNNGVDPYDTGGSSIPGPTGGPQVILNQPQQSPQMGMYDPSYNYGGRHDGIPSFVRMAGRF